MIFIGAELSDPGAHFVTNVVDSIGGGNDLLIDLNVTAECNEIFLLIDEHLKQYQELYVIYNAYEDEDFFFYFKSKYSDLKIIIFFSDEEWRHYDYDRYLALYSDVFTIAVKKNLELYYSYNMSPFYMRWACNPKMFKPVDVGHQDIDVSFIGAAYGTRIDCVRFLISHGVNVRVFGKGWGVFSDIAPYWGGYVSHQEMLNVIARTKINLNFLWTSHIGGGSTIKGRTLELSACRAFQLSTDTEEFGNYGYEDGKNIVVFEDLDQCLLYINYYLEDNERRKAIAECGFSHVVNKHTWQIRFDELFCDFNSYSRLKFGFKGKNHITIMLKKGVLHNITFCDERFDLEVVEFIERPEVNISSKTDMVIILENNSTICNESLYMMLFAILSDRTQAVIANFYISFNESNLWIRVKRALTERGMYYISNVPLDCVMMTVDCYINSRSLYHILRGKVSYIEYPLYWIDLDLFRRIKMSLFFGYHKQAKSNIYKNIKSFKWFSVLSIVTDKFYQKYILSR